MKVYEIVKLGQGMLDLLQKSCISMNDCGYVGMYEEYVMLVSDGAKKARVAAYLAKKYCISERRVYYLLKKFGKDCKLGADFVEETLCDPDGDTSNVLACFVAKMCNSGVPIYWERYI